MYKRIFDSHAHYDTKRFSRDYDQLLSEYLPSQGVAGIMSAGINLESTAKAQKLANKYDYVYFSAGIHPHDAASAPNDLEERLREFAKDPKMRAIGEIGLDYYRDLSPREIQKEVFIRHIKVAKELDLPIIVHNRDATADTMDILKEHAPKKGILHSFSGSVQIAQELVEMGFYLGFAGVLTYNNARRPVEVVEAIPVERLLLETDAPYLAPEPMRGKRSDSSMIAYTAEKMAEIKGMGTQELLDIVFENTCRVFEIEPEALKK